MIALLRGSIARLSGTTTIIDVQGVGYEVICSAACVRGLHVGQAAQIVIYTVVREDELTLYGFEDELEKQVFVLLTKVQGVGPRTAADIISKVEKRELLRTIGAGDVQRLQTVKGIGRKMSERIVVELKDKVSDFVRDRQELSSEIEREAIEPFEEAIQALQALGFSRKDAERAVKTAGAQGLPAQVSSGQIVREALRFV